MIDTIKKFFSRKEETPNYPSNFIIVDFSPISKQNGIRDDENKIIYRYYIDTFGNRKIKRYKYSPERLHSIMEVYEIPLVDKTSKKEILPIFGKMLPSEVSYNK